MPKDGSKLKRIIVLPFFLIMAAGFTLSWITYINGSREALRDTIAVILRETSERIAEEVSSRLAQATSTAADNAAFLAILPTNDSSKHDIQNVFLDEVGRTSMFALLCVGWADGEYIEIQRLQDESIRAGEAGSASGGDLVFRSALQGGGFGDVNFTVPAYDPRTRPWYRAAAERGGPAWSEPYTLYSNAEPVVAATVPIYRDDSLIGVTSVTISLDTLSTYLGNMKKDLKGLMYITDSEGRLVAISTTRVVDSFGARIVVADHPDPFVAASAHVAASSTHETSFSDPEAFSLRYDGHRYVGRSIPFSPGAGIQWKIVLTVDEAEYAQKLRSTDIKTALLLLTFLSVSLVVGFMIVVYITEPIRVMAENADLLTPGNDSSGNDVADRLEQFARRNNELGRLARAFLAMKIRLDQSFGDIEASLTEKDVLLKEVHHRVKNNLQIVSSILSIQSGTLDDERTQRAFEECQHRIQAMALVHEEVYRTGSFVELGMAGYLERICESLNWSGDRGSCRTVFHVRVDDSAALSLDKAIPCGLVVNELVTNALKHAFSGRDTGDIYVSFGLVANLWRLTVSDDGIGQVTAEMPSGTRADEPVHPPREGIGEQIVEGLVLQLGGTIRRLLPPDGGTSIVVEFPA